MPGRPGPIRQPTAARRAVGAAMSLALVLGAAPGAAAQVTPAPGAPAAGADVVVLLHGLGRTHRSMAVLESELASRGHAVVNIPYPSLRYPIEALADTLDLALRRCCAGATTLHFVTHSLGGIVVRSYAQRHPSERIGRVVMLSPPNHGSEVVDRLAELPVFEWVLGPAALELGTGPGSIPLALDPPAFEVGIIAGEASVNPLFSWWLPGRDDGKVAVRSAWLEGAADFLVVPYSHTFIMRRAEVVEEVARFLETGRFDEAPRDE